MTLEEQVKEVCRQAQENPTDKNLAFAVEVCQRWDEYLDGLLDAELVVDESVTVGYEGKHIKFKSIEDVAAWITTSDK